MAVIKATTISLKEYARLSIIERKYDLILFTITDPILSNTDKLNRIDEITEDKYKFKRGE